MVYGVGVEECQPGELKVPECWATSLPISIVAVQY